MSSIEQDVIDFRSSVDSNVAAPQAPSATDEDDGFSDVFQNQSYLTQFADLMEGIADRGATVAQLKDGTVFVSETRIVVHKHVWDKNKCVFIKQRTRNVRNTKAKKNQAAMIDEDSE
jgi:hypothetical protein